MTVVYLQLITTMQNLYLKKVYGLIWMYGFGGQIVLLDVNWKNHWYYAGQQPHNPVVAAFSLKRLRQMYTCIGSGAARGAALGVAVKTNMGKADCLAVTALQCASWGWFWCFSLFSSLCCCLADRSFAYLDSFPDLLTPTSMVAGTILPVVCMSMDFMTGLQTSLNQKCGWPTRLLPAASSPYNRSLGTLPSTMWWTWQRHRRCCWCSMV